MNESLIAIYMKSEVSIGLPLLEGLVRQGGFQLQNPRSGNITLIDGEGEDHVTEQQVLVARISQRQDTRFQFWESIWEGERPRDLYCRVVFKREAVVVEFSELPPEPDSLVKGFWRLFCGMLDDDQIIGLVIDRLGVTEEYADWDALFIEGQAYAGPCPDLVCVKGYQKELLPVAYLKDRRVIRGYHVMIFNEQLSHVLEG